MYDRMYLQTMQCMKFKFLFLTESYINIVLVLLQYHWELHTGIYLPVRRFYSSSRSLFLFSAGEGHATAPSYSQTKAVYLSHMLAY
jgi:hypothetical protein